MSEASTPAAVRAPRFSLASWIRIAVVATVLVTTLPLLYIVEHFAQGYAERQAGESLAQIAWQMRDSLDRGMSERYEDMMRISRSTIIVEGFKNPGRARETLERLQVSAPEFAWIGLTGMDGKVVASTGGLLQGVDVSARPWFKAAQQVPAVGDVHAALLLAKKLPVQNEPWRFVDISMPVRDAAGNTQGVLGGHLSWGWARTIQQELLEPRSRDLKTDVWIVKDDGEILLGPPGRDGGKLSLRSIGKAARGERGYEFEVWPDGKRYATSYVKTQGHRRYPGLGWIVLARQPEDVAIAGFNTLQERLVFASLLVCAFVLIMARALALRIARPLHVLSEAAKNLTRKQAEAGVIPVASDYREAAVLSRALADAVEAERKHAFELEKVNASLEQRVVDRTRALHAANENLVHALSEQAAAEMVARESSERLSTITDNLPVMIAYVDADRRYRFNNAAYSMVFGIETEALLGMRIGEMLDKDARERLDVQVDRVLKGEHVNFENVIQLHGVERVLACHFVPHDVGSGDIAGFYVMAQDVTLRKQMEWQLERQALQDSLTGLPNRRAFFDRLPQALSRADRWGKACAVLFLDMDGFKLINDRLGHDAGDELLQQFSRRLESCVRQVDTVARLAGDEFTVLLEALTAGADDACGVAQKIITAMQEPFQLCGEQVRMTTSIGIGFYTPRSNVDADALVADADRSMYEAKRSGKNQFRMAVDAEDQPTLVKAG